MSATAVILIVAILAVYGIATGILQERARSVEIDTLADVHNHELALVAETQRESLEMLYASQAREAAVRREADSEWSHLVRHAVEDGITALAVRDSEMAREREQWARLAVSANDPVNYGVLARTSRISAEDLGEAEIHRAERKNPAPPRRGDPAAIYTTPEGEPVIPAGAG